MTRGDIGIFTTDVSLVVQTWDPWMESVTAISSIAARGQALTELVPDLEARGFLPRFHETLRSGSVQVFAPAFHRYVLPAAPVRASRHFDRMQQRVTVAPLLDKDVIVGLMVTVQDVTRQLDAERDLAEALASPDPDQRRTAADAIATSSRIESLDSFAPALRDDDWKVRRAAVHALARAADADLIDAVLTTLRREHRNFSTLSSALKLLAATDIDITDPLVRLLGDADVDLRIQAALALGDQHDAGAIEGLIGALDDPDPNVRFHVIESLGRLRADAAVEPLAGIIESRDFFLSFAALDAVALINDARIAPRLVPLLDDGGLRPAVANALRSIADDRVVEPLVDVLNRTPEAALPVMTALAAISDRCERQVGNSAQVSITVATKLTAEGRMHALDAVRHAEADFLPAVVKVLGWLHADPAATALLASLLSDAAVRREALDALVQHGDAAVDPLIEQLSADDSELQRAAAGALARIGSRRATAALIELLPEPPLTIAVAGALAQIGDPTAFEPLLDLIDHPAPAVRQAVIGALNSIGHPSMPARVATLIGASDPIGRESAVRIAGYFGYRETSDAVLGAVSDPVEAVRVAALEHLPFLDDPQVPALLHRALETDTPRAKAAAARALGRIEGDDTGSALVAATGDADPWVRYYAARSLGERSYRPAQDRLAALAEFDPLPHVRAVALDALAAGYPDCPVDLLERCAAHPERDVAVAALAALGRVGDGSALAFLKTAARDEQPWRRLAALAGLAAVGSPEAVAQLEWLAGGDADTAVAAAAISALGDVAAAGSAGTQAAIDALISLCADAGKREHVVAVLTRLDPRLIPLVARGLVHPQPAVRKRVVDALGRFLHPQATGFVTRAFNDEDPVVRESAVIAIGRLGSLSSDDELKRLAETDPSKAVRRAAASALASMRRAG